MIVKRLLITGAFIVVLGVVAKTSGALGEFGPPLGSPPPSPSGFWGVGETWQFDLALNQDGFLEPTGLYPDTTTAASGGLEIRATSMKSDLIGKLRVRRLNATPEGITVAFSVTVERIHLQTGDKDVPFNDAGVREEMALEHHAAFDVQGRLRELRFSKRSSTISKTIVSMLMSRTQFIVHPQTSATTWNELEVNENGRYHVTYEMVNRSRDRGFQTDSTEARLAVVSALASSAIAHDLKVAKMKDNERNSDPEVRRRVAEFLSAN